MEYTKIQLRKRESYYDVAIYYSNTNCSVDEKKELIIPTGVKVPKKYITVSTKEISKKLPDYDTHYTTINEIKARVEIIISEYHKKVKAKPLCSYVSEQFQKPVVLETKKLEGVIDYYNQFLLYKSERVKESSMSFYNNNISCFEQFEEKRGGVKILLNEFEDLEFWNSFLYFLGNEKVDKTRVKMERKGLNNNTLSKRIKTYTEFLRYVTNVHEIPVNYFKVVDHIKVVKNKLNISNYEVSKFSLTFDELNYLYNFTPTVFEREKDIFVFMCLQGSRISDTISLQKHDITKKRGKYFIAKDAKKTDAEFLVELHPAAKEIWDKWDNSFDLYEQDFNERIKIVMKEFYLDYKVSYEERFDDEYETTINKKVKRAGQSKADITSVYKWNVISSHFGRETFISLLGAQSDKLSMKELMIKTGQKDMRVTLGYMKPTRDVSAEVLIPLTKMETKEKKVVKLKTA